MITTKVKVRTNTIFGCLKNFRKLAMGLMKVGGIDMIFAFKH
jgi:hypothetical protein